MTDFRNDYKTKQENILDYLKSLSLQREDSDVHISGMRRSGLLQVRGGQIVAAECGKLRGNGALLTLVAIGAAEVMRASPKNPVKHNVSVSVSQVARFFANLPSFSYEEGPCDEDQALEEAIRLFFQFRRKEAGAKLVTLLRSNRFYYPAWLWHSRLMTRDDYIKKSLNEARKWGNTDPLVLKEIQKIEPQLKGKSGSVRRCIFCWSLVGTTEESCGTCRGMQRISGIGEGWQPATDELRKSLSFYEEEMQKSPRNSRIAYCLCLGYCSLGQLDRARECINRALTISPKEPLFVKALEILKTVPEPALAQPVKEPQVRQPIGVQNATVSRSPVTIKATTEVGKTILVVEDSKTARKVVSMVLSRKGYRAIDATTGTEALLAIAGVTPDLVLLDVMLPDMSGYEVLSSIRENSELAKIPVIMLTGKRGAEDRHKGMTTGANEYLTKPFNPAKLLEVIGKYLGPSVGGAATPQPNYIKKVSMSPVPAQVATIAKKAAPVSPATQAVVVKPIETSRVVTEQTMSVVSQKRTEKSVLVVEDSPTSRKVISMVLSKKGYVVNEAATGGEALRKVRDVLPQLILLDAMLPDMTGYDILVQLKEDPQLKNIPVVMLTAKNSAIDREKGLRAGSSAYLTKPFNPDKLLSVIGSYMT